MIVVNGPPVALSASVSLTSGQQAVIDSGAMQSQVRNGMLVDEIYFHITGPGIPSDSSIMYYGGIIQAKISLGRIDLTDGFVPTWLFSPFLQPVTSGVGRPGSGAVGIVSAGNIVEYNHYRWKLQRPILVYPGLSLVTTIQRVNTFDSELNNTYLPTSSGMTVRVVYKGRTIQDKVVIPKHMEVPYASAYIPTNGQQISGDFNLLNKFDVPLTVDYMLGVVQSVNLVSKTIAETSGAFSNNISLVHSSGRNMTAQPLPMRQAFSRTFHLINEPFILEASERVIFKTATTVSATYRPMVSIVGHRTERFA